jgi:hypothetical protein
MAIGSSSPALNTGNATVCTAAPVNNFDQRGTLRMGGTDSSCDVGAYERNSPGTPTPTATHARIGHEN